MLLLLRLQQRCSRRRSPVGRCLYMSLLRLCARAYVQLLQLLQLLELLQRGCP